MRLESNKLVWDLNQSGKGAMPDSHCLLSLESFIYLVKDSETEELNSISKLLSVIFFD